MIVGNWYSVDFKKEIKKAKKNKWQLIKQAI
jgi:hypothetical protein